MLLADLTRVVAPFPEGVDQRRFPGCAGPHYCDQGTPLDVGFADAPSVQGSVAVLIRLLDAPSAFLRQHEEAVGQHRLFARSIASSQRASTEALYRGTLQRHSTEALYRGTLSVR